MGFEQLVCIESLGCVAAGYPVAEPFVQQSEGTHAGSLDSGKVNAVFHLQSFCSKRKKKTTE
jgi:hypothetical protein